MKQRWEVVGRQLQSFFWLLQQEHDSITIATVGLLLEWLMAAFDSSLVYVSHPVCPVRSRNQAAATGGVRETRLIKSWRYLFRPIF